MWPAFVWTSTKNVWNAQNAIERAKMLFANLTYCFFAVLVAVVKLPIGQFFPCPYKQSQKSLQKLTRPSSRLVFKLANSHGNSELNIFFCNCLPVSTACGAFVAVYDDATFTIESPEYPWPYRRGKSCSWRLCPPQGKSLEFNFTTFDLRTFDKLEIVNGK